MTRHSRTSRLLAALVAALVATLAATTLVSACSDTSTGSSGVATAGGTTAPVSSPPPSPSASTSAAAPRPWHPTYADLPRALPGRASLTGWHAVHRCLHEASACAHTPDGGGRGVLVSASGRRTHGGLAEMLLLSVIRWPTAAAARAAVIDRRRAEYQDFDGRFDRALTPVTDHEYRPGARGQGAIADLALGDWTGFRRDATFRYLQPERTTEPIRELYVCVSRGRLSVQAQVGRWVRHPGGTDAETTLDRLLPRFLDRLDAA